MAAHATLHKEIQDRTLEGKSTEEIERLITDYQKKLSMYKTPNERRLLKDLKATENHVAVIAMYPWEADHLLKAEEIARRGVQVAKPLGRLFTGELEFALFQWVNGSCISTAGSSAAWDAYGRVMRFCHEHGIAVDDAAGRNALWNGSEIMLIDFEHTWLREDGRALTERERKCSLARITNELREKTDLMRAFLRGYETG
jgi:tRNA A-37 threonylcarbamoyl transferase component Bud32